MNIRRAVYVIALPLLFFSKLAGAQSTGDYITDLIDVRPPVAPYSSQLLWQNGQQVFVYDSLDLNPLRFTNRAQCALDASKPTQSTFLILDAFNAGQAAYLAAQAKGWKVEEFLPRTERAFRMAVAQLTLEIARDLLAGNLPLLPVNVDDGGASGAEYRQAARACGEEMPCPALDRIIEKIWKARGSKQASYDALNFGESNRVGCYYLKKFSALEGHLYTPIPNDLSLRSVALAALKSSEYITDCFDGSEETAGRRAALQIDFLDLPDKRWETHGFDFWNSLKTYLSWAWRNAQTDKFGKEFSNLFRSVALEESIMFVPNGCKSITPPSCDSRYISANALRTLATQNLVDSDRALSRGPEKDLVENPYPPVNTDILGTTIADSATGWVKGLRERFDNSRSKAKIRFYNATNLMNLVMDNLAVDEIFKSMDQVIDRREETLAAKNLVFYLCSEFGAADNPQWSSLRTDLEVIEKVQLIDQSGFNQGRRIAELYDFYKKLAAGVTARCDDIARKQFFDTKFQFDRRGLMPWYKDLYKLVTDSPPAGGYRVDGKPLLALSSAMPGSVPEALCTDGVDCARKVLKAVIDLYSVTLYADSVLPLRGVIPSPSMANPYAERVACKIYDPWFKTKSAFTSLAIDLANTAAFGWNPIPIYFSGELRPGQVTSLKKLYDDKKIIFDPQRISPKLQGMIWADLGPYFHVPCTVSLGNVPAAPGGYYMLEGISVEGCKSTQTNTVNTTGPGDIQIQAPSNRTACASCHLNLTSTTVVDSATGFMPVKFGVMLFRSVLRFFTSLNDPVNVPKTNTVDVNAAAHAYMRYGTIPARCSFNLKKGMECFENKCVAALTKYFEDKYQAPVAGVWSGDSGAGGKYTAFVNVASCTGKFYVESKVLGPNCEIASKVLVTNEKAIGDCRNLLPSGRQL